MATSNNDYHGPHWPKFNGKYPEDMTSEEIWEYVDKDDFKSIYLIIRHSRGYFSIEPSLLFNELLKKIEKKEENIKFINRIVDILLEMYPKYSKDYLLSATKANATDIINHINTRHYEYYEKNIDTIN